MYLRCNFRIHTFIKLFFSYLKYIRNLVDNINSPFIMKGLLEGKVAIVTGGTRGIGMGIVSYYFLTLLIF